MAETNLPQPPLVPFAISSDVVSIRTWNAGDLHLVEEASADEMIPLITTVPSGFTPASGEAFILRQNRRLETGEGWSMVIADPDSDQALGQIGLWISQINKGRAEIGYWVGASARGEGAAGAALGLLVDWAFDQLPVHRLSLFIEEWNVASVRTAENAEFEREALLRNWELVDGHPRDMWSFVRLRGS